MTLSFFLLTLALSTPVLKTHGSPGRTNPVLYDGVSPSEFLHGHLGKIGVLKHSPEYFSLLSKTDDTRGEIDDSPDELEDFEDMIEMAKNLHDQFEDSGSEIDDDAPDEIEDIEDIVNETINNTNEFAKDDEDSEAKSRTRRFAPLVKEIQTDKFSDFSLLGKTVDHLRGIIEDAGSDIDAAHGQIDDLADEILKDLPDEIEDMDEIINLIKTAKEELGREIDDARGEIGNLPDEIENFWEMIKMAKEEMAKEELESEIDDARDNIDNSPEDIEDFEDMIEMAKNLHDLYEDSGSEIDDVGDEIDDLTDAVEDSEDIVNETINNTNEFVKDDEESEAKSRTRRFAPLFDPLRFFQRQVMGNRVRPNIPYIFINQGRPGVNSRGAVRVNTGVDPKAIRYGRTGAGYPQPGHSRRPRFKK
jgi:chromosome segregation ATPase